MSIPTDIYESVHFDMVRAHQTFTTGFDSIVKHLKEPPLKDLKNFLGYLEAWAVAILHHHDTEEATVFPVLNTKMNFEHEQEQHKVLHKFLDSYLEVVRAAQKDTSTFDAATLIEIMEAGKDDLLTHLKDELVDIQPQKLRDSGLTEAELKAMDKEMQRFAQKTGDPFMVVPFMISHTPPEFKYWPALPWFLRKVMIPYMLAMKHSGYWKYAPYSMS